LSIPPSLSPANEYFGAIIIDERAACQADPAELVYSKKARSTPWIRMLRRKAA